MAMTDDLIRVLKKLRLSGVLNTLDLRTQEAVDGDLSHSEFLFRLCSDEVERREAKQLDLRLRRAAGSDPAPHLLIAAGHGTHQAPGGGGARTSRLPLASSGPTMPVSSMCSIMRAARL